MMINEKYISVSYDRVYTYLQVTSQSKLYLDSEVYYQQ